MRLQQTAQEMLSKHNWSTIEHYMDGEICETLYDRPAPCSELDFLNAYTVAHAAKFEGETFTIN